MCNQPNFACLPPSQVVPKLTDLGMYMGSESSFYRVLHEHAQVQHRGRSQEGKSTQSPVVLPLQGLIRYGAGISPIAPQR